MYLKRRVQMVELCGDKIITLIFSSLIVFGENDIVHRT